MYVPTQKKVQGKEKKNYFTNCSIPSVSTEGRLIAINDKYLVMPWLKPGLISIVDSNNPINLSQYNNLFETDKSNILDLEFSPFNSNILAICNENNSVILSYINEDKNNFDQSNCYKGHKNKVGFVNFNPIVSNLMCSSTLYGEIHVWDSYKMKPIYEYKVTSPNSIFWNPNGSLIGVSTKTKYFYVYDPRQKNIVYSQQISQTMTSSKFAWLDNESIATIGWNANSNKFLYLYDIKKKEKSYSSIFIDNFNSPTVPFVDPEMKLIYSVGKEESYINIYDYNSEVLKKYPHYTCTETNYFSILLNRKYLDKNSKEVDRFARFTKTKRIYYISFIYKNQGFESDQVLYPNENLNRPQLTIDQWTPENTQNTQSIKKVVYQRKQSNDSINKDNIPSDNYKNKNERNNGGITINSKNNNLTAPNYKNKFINININTHKTDQPVKVNSNNQNLSYNYGGAENECNNCIRLRNQISQLETEKNKLQSEYSTQLNIKMQIEEEKYKKEFNKINDENMKLKSENNIIKNSSYKLNN